MRSANERLLSFASTSVRASRLLKLRVDDGSEAEKFSPLAVRHVGFERGSVVAQQHCLHLVDVVHVSEGAGVRALLTHLLDLILPLFAARCCRLGHDVGASLDNFVEAGCRRGTFPLIFDELDFALFRGVGFILLSQHHRVRLL